MSSESRVREPSEKKRGNGSKMAAVPRGSFFLLVEMEFDIKLIKWKCSTQRPEGRVA